jgi:hypothetical protein
MQPANTSRLEMFGSSAPIWRFLEQYGGPGDPINTEKEIEVIETYPVLAVIALGWTLSDDKRPAGRLPKYNPERKRRSLSLIGDTSAARLLDSSKTIAFRTFPAGRRVLHESSDLANPSKMRLTPAYASLLRSVCANPVGALRLVTALPATS